MEKKTLFTNGCSWTWGGALEEYWNNENERLKLVWTYHLGQLLGVDDVVNYSIACGSNQRIMRTTVDWLTSKTKEELQNTIAIIQWTELSRYEYYVMRNPKNQVENIQHRWLLNKIDNVSTNWDVSENYHKNNTVFFMDNPKNRSQKVELDKDDFKYNNDRLKRFTNIESVYSLTSYCETLSSLFEKFGVEYYFWEFLKGPMLFYDMPENLRMLHESYNWINVSGYESLSQSPLSSLKNKNDQHPSLLGHKQISDIIYKQIR
jgi:hypothetical protein